MYIQIVRLARNDLKVAFQVFVIADTALAAAKEKEKVHDSDDSDIDEAIDTKTLLKEQVKDAKKEIIKLKVALKLVDETSEKYCDSMGVLEIFKPPEGFCPNLYFLGVWKCLFRGFDFEICQIGVLIF